MRLAIAQTPARSLADWQATLTQLEQTIADAAAQGADLVLLPEGAWPAYAIGSLAAWRAARRDGMPDGPAFLERLQAAARGNEIMICAGYLREQDDRLANVASLVGPAGTVLATHVKTFLWDFDNEWFVPGRTLEPVATPLGRIGMLICADARLPEVAATLVTRGAELLLQPTAWVNGGTAEQPWNPQPDFLIAARAREFGVPVASASKYGIEHGTLFVGQSLICDARGQRLVQAGRDETELLSAEVTPRQSAWQLSDDEARKGLLANDEPVSPAADIPPLRLLLCPPAEAADRARRRLQDLVERLPTETALLVVDGGQLADEPLPKGAVRLTGPSAGRFRVGPITLAGVAADTLATFAVARLHALAGVHLLVAFGDLDETLVRARAMENRIFLAVLANKTARLFAPSSFEVPHHDAIDLRPAVDKQVIRGTDVLRGRQPSIYEF